jgi:hypothetical protein
MRNTGMVVLTALLCVVTTGCGGGLSEDVLTAEKRGDSNLEAVTVTCRQSVKVFSVQVNDGAEQKPYSTKSPSESFLRFYDSSEAKSDKNATPIESYDCPMGKKITIAHWASEGAVVKFSIKTDKGSGSYEWNR